VTVSWLFIPAALMAQQVAEPPPAEEPAGAQPVPETAPTWEVDVPPVDPELIDGRTRPGYTAPLPDRIDQRNEGAIRAPPPTAFPTDQLPIPDRWRLIETLGLVKENILDPYNQNTYKGDRPINREKVPWQRTDQG
jgi:hypothetical protein